MTTQPKAPSKSSGSSHPHSITKTSSVAVTPIHFKNPDRDEKNVSQFSLSILNQIRMEAGLTKVTINSALRSPAKQAEIMYGHEVERVKLGEKREEDQRRVVRDKMMLDPNNPQTRAQYEKDVREYQVDLMKKVVNYKGEGHHVQLTAQRGIRSHEDPSVTQGKMTAEIHAALAKGIAVSNHLGRAHIEVVDIDITTMTHQQRQKFLGAIKRRFGSGVLRVGHPAGPARATPHEFNDTDCFHIELLQLNQLDEIQRIKTTA